MVWCIPCHCTALIGFPGQHNGRPRHGGGRRSCAGFSRRAAGSLPEDLPADAAAYEQARLMAGFAVPRRAGALALGSDSAITGTAALQALVDVVPEGGTLLLQNSYALDAPLRIAASITIQGEGAGTTRLTLADGYTGRHIIIEGGAAETTIASLTLDGGGTGGGIELLGGSLLLAEIVMANNAHPGGFGGAVASPDAGSTVTLAACRLVGNTAADGGAVYAGGGLVAGGSILATGAASAVLNDTAASGTGGTTLLYGNSAGRGNGGALYTGELVLGEVDIYGNTATGSGGGVYVENGSLPGAGPWRVEGNSTLGPDGWQADDVALADGGTPLVAVRGGEGMPATLGEEKPSAGDEALPVAATPEETAPPVAAPEGAPQRTLPPEAKPFVAGGTVQSPRSTVQTGDSRAALLFYLTTATAALYALVLLLYCQRQRAGYRQMGK